MNMRLTQKEIKAIKKTFLEIFQEGKIYLFGSRVNDAKRGGDIDLYIELPYRLDVKEMLQKKTAFKLKLYSMIGEQKIDIIFSQKSPASLKKEIAKQRIEL